MNSEQKICQNCKQSFVIEPEDFEFYEKIKVPAPTFCPDCRLQRRLAFYNIFNLYRRPCDLCKKDVMSMYAPDAPCKVYCPKCWWSDDWDPYEYGREYNFERPFFEQYKELWHETPMLGLSLDVPTAEQSPYNNHAGHLKNCYMLFHGDDNEDCAYGFDVIHSKSVMDCSLLMTCEMCYDSSNMYKVNRGIGNEHQVTESIDCFFLRDCKSCQNCFASANLRNKQYHIFNKPYSKEEYFTEIRKYDLGSYKMYKEIKEKAREHWKNYPPNPDVSEFIADCTGSFVFQSKNCKECFEVVGAEDCKFMSIVADPPIKDCYDITSWGNGLELAYECCVVGENSRNVKFCEESGINLFNAEYCKLSTGGSNHFGCVAVKKGNYVIFNKRYTEEEFKTLREKIMKHMDDMPYTDKKGRVYKYGEFFPIELSPFAYNTTIANDFFPLSKDTIESNGYAWHESEKGENPAAKKADELPDNIKDAQDSITKEVTECIKCGRGFRIIQMELEFLRKMNVPLPRKCPFCRINEKFKLWITHFRQIDRICDKCGTGFKTHFSEDDAPLILCKKCYHAEVI